MAKTDANLSQCPPAWSTTLFPFFPCLLVVFFALNVVGVPPNPRSLVVFSSLPASGTADEGSTAVARKQLFELQNHPGLNNNKEIIELKIQYLTGDEQRQFLLDRVEECSFRGVAAAHVFEFLQGRNEEIQSEIFKWCALATSSFDVSVWLDSRSPILNMAAFQSTVSSHQNVAVVDSDLIHGSYLKLMASKSNKTLALHMLQTLLKADLKVLQSYALLVPKTLKKFIAETETDWQYLNLSCRKGASPQVPMGQSNTVCPTTGYCCSIQDARTTILLSRHYMLPALSIPDKLPMKPFNARDDDDDNDDMDDHFISTIQVKDLDPVDDGETPNFYDLLSRNHCLPDQDDCTKCLREKKGATCDSCGTHCVCYCQKLCHTVVPAKRVVQEWTISPPLYTKDPSRLVPRVIHQTWFEELNEESYPNMSRLVESFKRSGWEYRFYTDDDAIAFLRRHFPRPVLEAYQTLVPGAFKADLFRYCVLLIVGGVYADVDVHLESALDVSIPPDVGFMVPVDEVCWMFFGFLHCLL